MATDAHREANRRYRAAHREEINERTRQRRAASADELRQKRRERWERDKEKVRADQNRWRAANRERVRGYWLRDSHGMTHEDWSAMWDAQGGRCYLCGDELPPQGVHIDHDHGCCPPRKSCSRCRRGMACKQCNQLIGLAGEDPDRLERIAAALRLAQHLTPSSPWPAGP